jgi:uncharacterized protein DUF4386
MTTTTNARLAGFAFLLYIVTGIAAMALSGHALRGDDVSSCLASIASHAPSLRAATLLNLAGGFCALVLGVTLYAITKEEDHDLALLGLVFRIAEGVLGAASIQRSLGLLWLATSAEAGALHTGGREALGAYLLHGPSAAIGAVFFAVGSALFSWLLWRGRMIPAVLAWTGVIASALLVVTLPLQLVGLLRGMVVQVAWLPMAAFEVPLAFWLLFKGVRVRGAAS